MGAAARYAMIVVCMAGCGRIAFDATDPDALDGGAAAADASFTTRRWVNRAVSGPGPLWGPLLAFHDARGTVMMYGGYYNLLANHEFWELGAFGWTRLCSSCPPGRREGHMMAYDPDRNRLVMFGGLDSTTLDDLWEWDGVNWIRIMPPGPTPGPLSHGQMIYDAGRRRMVMIGGCTAGGASTADIWEYDGVSWTQRIAAGGPAAIGSSGQQIVYDPIGQRVLVLGDECNTGDAHDELWSWDGTEWALVCANCTGRPRDSASIVYDEALGTVLLLGGDDRTSLDGTWRLVGNRFEAWDLLPPGRYNMGITYDRARHTIVVYGGYTTLNCPRSFCDETWEFVPN